MKFTYSSVSSSDIQKMLTELSNNGFASRVTMNNQWQVTGAGVNALANYGQLSQTLEVMIVSKPFLISYEFIDQKIKEALGRAL